MKPDEETLRRLYEGDRLSTRKIGLIYGVRHISVRRWLILYGIDSRPTGRGLENRGVAAPSTDELFDLVHVQHLSYVKIAARYGVDQSAVPYWLKKHGIPLPDAMVTKRKGKPHVLPTVEELAHRRQLGESLHAIAKSCGVDRRTISNLCHANGIPVDRDGWNGGQRLPCRDGHEARSVYEQRVDDWLASHGLAHEVEPSYPFDGRYRSDFLVANTYIEVWGVTNNAAYQARKSDKISLCKANNLPLISINMWQFAKGRKWWKPLEALLPKSVPSHLF